MKLAIYAGRQKPISTSAWEEDTIEFIIACIRSESMDGDLVSGLVHVWP